MFFTFILFNFLLQALQYFQKKIKFIFCPWEHRKIKPQKLLIIVPKLFFTVLPSCPNQPKIDSSYYKYVSRLICLLICAVNKPITFARFFDRKCAKHRLKFMIGNPELVTIRSFNISKAQWNCMNYEVKILMRGKFKSNSNYWA